MILLSFFVFKLKISSLTLFLQLLIALPVMYPLLEPLLHESSVTSHFVNLRCSEVLKSLFSCFKFIPISGLGYVVLSHLLITELFEATFHENFFLRFVQNLQPMMEEGGCLLLILFFRLCNFHCRAVIANFTSYNLKHR